MFILNEDTTLFWTKNIYFRFLTEIKNCMEAVPLLLLVYGVGVALLENTPCFRIPLCPNGG